MSQARLAEATDLDPGTISRLIGGKDGKGPRQNPRIETALRISRWADEVARQKRLPKRKWLTWDHLLPKQQRKAS